MGCVSPLFPPTPYGVPTPVATLTTASPAPVKFGHIPVKAIPAVAIEPSPLIDDFSPSWTNAEGSAFVVPPTRSRTYTFAKPGPIGPTPGTKSVAVDVKLTYRPSALTAGAK